MRPGDRPETGHWSRRSALAGVVDRARGDVDRLRTAVNRYDVLLVAYVAFLSLILVFFDTRIYRPVFYFAVIPLFALSGSGWRWWIPARSPVWLASAALILYLWAALTWGADPVSGEALLKELRRAVCVVLFVAITAQIACDTRRTGRLVTAFSWIAAIIALAAIADHYGSHSRDWRVGGFGTLLNPNLSGGIYGMLVILAFAWTVQAARSRRARLLQAVPCVAMLAFALLTGSRTTLVALVAAILAGAALRRAWWLVALLLGPPLLYFALWAAGLVPEIGYIQRGDSYRLAAWGHFWPLALERVWFGHGAAFDQSAGPEVGIGISHPHNIYLSALLLGGLPALLLLLAVFGAALRAAWREWRTRAGIGPVMLVLYLFVHGLFDDGVYRANAGWEWVYFWLPMGLVAGLELRREEGRLP